MLKTFYSNLVIKSIRFWTIILFSAICCSCTKSINSSADFEKLMGAKLPEESTIQYAKNAGDAGAIIVVHFSKTNFPAFSASCVGYGKWNELTNQMSFEAAGKKFHALTDLDGEYSVGKVSGGISQVLIWDDKSETLTGLLSTGAM
jgi:hypothetical protein